MPLKKLDTMAYKYSLHHILFFEDMYIEKGLCKLQIVTATRRVLIRAHISENDNATRKAVISVRVASGWSM